MSAYYDNIVGAYDDGVVPDTLSTDNLDQFYDDVAGYFPSYDTVSIPDTVYSGSSASESTRAVSDTDSLLDYFSTFTGSVLDLGRTYIQLDQATKNVQTQKRFNDAQTRAENNRIAVQAARDQYNTNRQLRAVGAGGITHTDMTQVSVSTIVIVGVGLLAIIMIATRK